MRHTLFKFLALFCMAFTSAQNVNISGTIQDESGIPIPGVNIIVKNTTKGSVSDFDGNFTV
ncbi:MAG TPA: carboxypeptidase-like regulatory domain-containing protein, partial [Yeosuana sp.]